MSLKNNFVQRKFCGSKIIKLVVVVEEVGGKYGNLKLKLEEMLELGVWVSFESSKSQRCHLGKCLELCQVNVGMSSTKSQVHNLADS